MPCYLVPHWSLSPLCHHRVALRLEEDDNGRSKQFASIDNQCHGLWLNYWSSTELCKKFAPTPTTTVSLKHLTYPASAIHACKTQWTCKTQRDEDNNMTSDIYVVHIYKLEQETGKLHGQLDTQRQSDHYNMGTACVLGHAWMKMVFCGCAGNRLWLMAVKMMSNEVCGTQRKSKNQATCGINLCVVG